MKITFYFTNLDNFMDTKESASVTMDIAADDERHGYMLAQHLQKVLQADFYVVED